MPRFLRTVRKARWSNPSWAGGLASDQQGDALADFSTTSNALSVYLVDSEDAIQQVVAGLAAGRSSLSNLDYAVIEADLLDRMNLQAVQTPGQTPHQEANNLHHDIVNLTAANVLGLVQSITINNVQRVPVQKVKAFLERSIRDGHIDTGALGDSLSRKLR